MDGDPLHYKRGCLSLHPACDNAFPRKRNRAQVRNLRRDGSSLSQIIAKHRGFLSSTTSLPRRSSSSGTSTRSRKSRPQKRTSPVRSSARPGTLQAHVRLVAKRNPRPFADVLAITSRQLAPQEQDDRPAMEQASDSLSCDNGLEAVTIHLQLHGYEPGPTLMKVYGEHLPEMRALEARLKETGRQRCDHARRLEDLRSKERDSRRAVASTAETGPSETDQPRPAMRKVAAETESEPTRSSIATNVASVPMHPSPGPKRPASDPPTEKEIKAFYGAVKRDMLRRLKTAQERGESLFDIIVDTPKAPSEKLDDACACALFELWLEKAIGPIADHEKEVVGRLLANAPRYEVLRRAREALIREIEPRALALLLERNGADLLAASYDEMAKRLLARPDCVCGLRTWMAKNDILAEPALSAFSATACRRSRISRRPSPTLLRNASTPRRGSIICACRAVILPMPPNRSRRPPIRHAPPSRKSLSATWIAASKLKRVARQSCGRCATSWSMRR